ncbi:MAG: hypothetical protein Q7U38_05490, partial [Methylobacter sp.]|nr:hypothetical protein [Methylobacter sp.]
VFTLFLMAQDRVTVTRQGQVLHCAYLVPKPGRVGRFFCPPFNIIALFRVGTNSMCPPGYIFHLLDFQKMAYTPVVHKGVAKNLKKWKPKSWAT